MPRDESWREYAACKDADTELFFPPRDKDTYRLIAAEAKVYCYGTGEIPECPVRKECLMYAINTDEVHGIWGGMSHRERNALLRKWVTTSKPRLSLEEYVEIIGRKTSGKQHGPQEIS